VGALVAAGAAVGGASYWKQRHQSQAGERTKRPAAGAAPGVGNGGASLRVNAVQLAYQPLAEKLSATGTLRAEESVELQAETNGKVIQVAFQEGTRVRRGDLLVKLNDADLHAQLTRSVFRRELAELKERRLSQLLESGSVRQDEYDAAVSDLNVQRAEVTLAEALIAKTEIRAPFDGIVGLRFVSEGTFVTPTSRIATLQNLDNVKVDFSVPEKYASRVKPGSTATFQIAGVDARFEGKIYASDPRVDAGTRTVLLRALCPNPQGQLLPGAFASIEFNLTEITNAILVPSVSVVPGVSEKYVFVVEDGKAVRRPVQVGTRTESAVQIVEGLKPGEWVITSGIQQLRGGLSVNVLDMPKEKSAKAAVEKGAAPANAVAAKDHGLR